MERVFYLEVNSKDFVKLLKDAPIIVLDEATAFTDPENEHLILKAFRELMENKTVLMIAHRLNSIIDCDQILVVERGEIVEQR